MRRALVLMSLVVVLGACSARETGAPVTRDGTTARGLAHPRVAVPDPSRPRYVRDEWQPDGWEDEDHDGCNTRAEVLMVESKAPTTRKPGGCTILTGRWDDPYTGREFTDASQVQIDHLVALGDAAASGGWAWQPWVKKAFANDLGDEWALNAVSGQENQRKSDDGPDTWLPPNARFRCTYVAAYARIKARWDLTVTPAQWSAIEAVWAGCGGGMTPVAWTRVGILVAKVAIVASPFALFAVHRRKP